MRAIVVLLILFATGLSLLGVILVSELGQIINLPREWVVGYFEVRKELSLLVGLTTLLAIYLQIKQDVLKRALFLTFIGFILVSIFVINWFVPYYWLRSEQHDATFISIDEADPLLRSDQDVLVLEINGDARAYPRKWMELPHFAGHQVGGEEVVMSYCALSNLPQAFSTEFHNQSADYRVIAQVHNNLIFTDTQSGELFQQITGVGEFSGESPKQFPVQRMPWRAFKALYPEGQVFFTQPNFLDQGTRLIFDSGLKSQYAGDPLFPTLDLKDKRLPFEEAVWGLREGGESIAIPMSAFETETIRHFELGGQHFVAAWQPEHETIDVFHALKNGEPIKVDSVDSYGMTAQGQLERAHIYPGMLWMVWSHWFPATAILD